MPYRHHEDRKVDRGRIEREGRRMARAVAVELRDQAARRTPVADLPSGLSLTAWTSLRGGRLPGTARRSWHVGPVRELARGEFVCRVESDDPVVVFLEGGTVAHKITARNGKALAFRGAGGKTVLRQSVNHPGTPAYHMMRDALAAMVLQAPQVAREELARGDIRDAP